MSTKVNQKNELTTTSPNPGHLLQLALEKNVDTVQLKELMDLQERWEKKEAKKNFFAALSKFQTLIPALKKNKTANISSQKGSFKYKYADLGSITNSIKKHLMECGLAYRWEFAEQNGKMRVTCFISHLDGHTETSSMEAAFDNSGAKNDIQQKGSTQTYLQRYTLIGALGLSTADEDNDAKFSKDSSSTELTDDDVMDQWRSVLAGVNSKLELQSLYLKNRKAVDGDKAIQRLFKDREAEFKKTTNHQFAMP